MKKRRDGTGSVFQRADGMWVAQAHVPDEHRGGTRRVRKYASTRDQARALLARLRVEPPAATVAPEGTVAEYLAQWAESTLPVTGRAPATQALYRNLIRSPIRPTLDGVRLSQFTPAEVDRWLGRLDRFRKHNGEPLSASTKRSSYAAVTVAMDTAVRDGLIAENPVRRTRRPAKDAEAVPVLSAAEVDRLLDAARGRRIEPLLLLVAFTGCRVGEATSLRWSDVDLDAAKVMIRRGSLDRRTTKTGQARSVPLVPEAVEALRAERRWQNEQRLALGAGWADTEGLVFTSAVGTPVGARNSRRALAAVLCVAGLPTDRPWHTLRHSLATRLLNRGTPMPVVSAILGHRSIRTTVDVYGHAEPALSAAALAEALAR